MNKNVIVTGATGFVGRYLLAELLQNGYNVYAVVRTPEKLPKYDNDTQLHIIHKDLEQLTAGDLGNVQIDTFFHLGWAGVNRDEIDDEAEDSADIIDDGDNNIVEENISNNKENISQSKQDEQPKMGTQISLVKIFLVIASIYLIRIISLIKL